MENNFILMLSFCLLGSAIMSFAVVHLTMTNKAIKTFVKIITKFTEGDEEFFHLNEYSNFTELRPFYEKIRDVVKNAHAERNEEVIDYIDKVFTSPKMVSKLIQEIKKVQLDGKI